MASQWSDQEAGAEITLADKSNEELTSDLRHRVSEEVDKKLLQGNEADPIQLGFQGYEWRYYMHIGTATHSDPIILILTGSDSVVMDRGAVQSKGTGNGSSLFRRYLLGVCLLHCRHQSRCHQCRLPPSQGSIRTQIQEGT